MTDSVFRTVGERTQILHPLAAVLFKFKHHVYVQLLVVFCWWCAVVVDVLLLLSLCLCCVCMMGVYV